MKIRMHQGGLTESMLIVTEIEPTKQAILDYIISLIDIKNITLDMIKIEKYGDSIDIRNGWNTHIVTIDNYGVFGMTDGSIISP